MDLAPASWTWVWILFWFNWDRPPFSGKAGGKAYALSPMQEFIPMTSQRVDHSFDQLVMQNGTEMAIRQSLAFLRSVDRNSVSMYSSNALQASYYPQGNKVNAIGAQNENSLFSSSLPELFSRKCKPLSVSLLQCTVSPFRFTVCEVKSLHWCSIPYVQLFYIESSNSWIFWLVT